MSFLIWYQFKLFLEHASGISMDAFHILLGFGFFFLAAALIRRTVADLSPWLATLAMELLNEVYDLTTEIWPDSGRQLGEAAKDIMLTMALPTLVMIVARRRPARFGIGIAGGPSADDQVANRTEVPVAVRGSPRLEDER